MEGPTNSSAEADRCQGRQDPSNLRCSTARVNGAMHREDGADGDGAERQDGYVSQRPGVDGSRVSHAGRVGGHEQRRHEHHDRRCDTRERE